MVGKCEKSWALPIRNKPRNRLRNNLTDNTPDISTTTAPSQPTAPSEKTTMSSYSFACDGCVANTDQVTAVSGQITRDANGNIVPSTSKAYFGGDQISKGKKTDSQQVPSPPGSSVGSQGGAGDHTGSTGADNGCSCGNDYGDVPGSICFSPDATVLLADWSHVRVGSLELGDLPASAAGSATVSALYRDRRPKAWISFNEADAFVTSTHPVSTAHGFITPTSPTRHLKR